MCFLSVFSGVGRTKCFGVRMCWADSEAVGALARAVGDYFDVE